MRIEKYKPENEHGVMIKNKVLDTIKYCMHIIRLKSANNGILAYVYGCELETWIKSSILSSAHRRFIAR